MYVTSGASLMMRKTRELGRRGFEAEDAQCKTGGRTEMSWFSYKYSMRS